MSVQINRRWFNVDEYYRMTDAGILSEGDRVELIEGEVVKMSPIGRFHAACVKTERAPHLPSRTNCHRRGTGPD
ncbi:MAG: hypothetical protein WAV20_25815 [Blastocatellia bacterium]